MALSPWGMWNPGGLTLFAMNDPLKDNDALRKAKEEDNQRFIDEERAAQQQIMRRQDQDLDQFNDEVVEIAHISREIGDTLREHNRRLSDLDDHFERTQGRVEGATNKIKEFLKKGSKWQWIGCIILTLVIIGLILWAFVF